MRRHSRALGALIVVVASSLLLGLGLTAPAYADDYPTWDDVEAARKSEAKTAAAISDIEGYLVQLEIQAAQLHRTAQIKGEEYNIARENLEAAAEAAARLQRQATDAEHEAALSSRRAGQLVAQFARTGGRSLGLSLLLNPDSDDLLSGLGTMGKLTEQTTLIYRQAEQDRNAAQSLTDQASVAEAARRERETDAQDALEEAKAASAQIGAQLATEIAAADKLYDQLAALKGTTAEIERLYLEGLTEGEGPGTEGPGTGEPGTPTPTPTPTPTKTGTPGPTPTKTSTPTPTPTPTKTSTPTPTPTPTKPPTTTDPSSKAVEAAIKYATAQLGDRYAYGGAGPSSWDCSGLTKASYAAAGIYIGVHGATSQYNYLKGEGLLLPMSQLKRGDLLFYSDGGSKSGTKYHTTIYIGNGKMIEAAYEGIPVRTTNVRTYDLVQWVARPSM